MSAQIPYLVLSYEPKCCQPIKLQGSYFSYVSKNVMNNNHFWHVGIDSRNTKDSLVCKFLLGHGQNCS